MTETNRSNSVNGSLPDYIAKQLAEPAPGNPGRHEAWTKLSLEMVGEGIPDKTIFHLLRAWIPDRDKPDSELRRAIAGAHQRNPQPATTNRAVRLTYSRPAGTVPKEPTIPPFELVSPAEIVPLPKEECSAAQFLKRMFGLDDCVGICWETKQNESGKWIPKDDGHFATVKDFIGKVFSQTPDLPKYVSHKRCWRIRSD